MWGIFRDQKPRRKADRETFLAAFGKWNFERLSKNRVKCQEQKRAFFGIVFVKFRRYRRGVLARGGDFFYFAFFLNSGFREIGASGTDSFAGYISEEYVSALAFPENIKIFDKMRKSDASVQAALRAIKLPILGANFSFVPASDDAKDIEIAEKCEWQFFEKIVFSDFLRHALLACDFGFSLFEKVFGIDQEKNLVYFRKLAPRLPKSIQKWETEKDGKAGITQYAVKNGNYKSFSIPKEKLFHLAFDQEGDNFEGVSILRSCYQHWFFKSQIYRIQAIAAERTGVGVPTAKFTKNAPKESEIADAEKILRNLRANEEAFIIEKGGVEFRFESPNSQFDFEPIINHHDRQIVKSILAQFLEIGVSKGGNSQSDSQQNLFLLGCKALANNICEKINRDLVRQFVDFNFVGVEKYPKIVVNDIGGKSLDAFALVIERLTRAGVITPDDGLEDFLRDTMNLPDRQNARADAPKKIEKKIEKDPEKKIEKVIEKDDDEKTGKVKNANLSDEKKYWRALTLAEEKADIEKFAEILGKNESEIFATIEKNSKKIQSEFSTRLRKGIEKGSIAEFFPPKIWQKLSEEMAGDLEKDFLSALEDGKALGVKELGEKRFPTPAAKKEFLKEQSKIIAEKHANDLKNEMILAAQNEIRKDATAEVIVSNATLKMAERAKKQIPIAASISASISVNQGIGTAWENFADRIWGWQYSAILDEKTSPQCRALDRRVSRKKGELPTPPIHFRCRSRLVSIDIEEKEKPEENGLPDGFQGEFPNLLSKIDAGEILELAEKNSFSCC
jgi:hypothetical protein